VKSKKLTDFNVIELDNLNVMEFCPATDGNAPCTEVHIVCNVKGDKGTIMIIRLKSRDVAMQLIAALEGHTNNIWPPN
jgi:hypothetical protein